MEKARLETFADGVFAIAATLLIIDVSVRAQGHELGHAVLHAWPEYAAYAVSFMTINLLLLMCIAFVPFPTRLVAEHFHDGGLRAAALTYGVTMTATAICFGLFWFYAARGRRLIHDEADPRVIAGISRSYLPGAPIYLAATLVAFWSPKASVALFALIALLYILESSVFARPQPSPAEI